MYELNFVSTSPINLAMSISLVQPQAPPEVEKGPVPSTTVPKSSLGRMVGKRAQRSHALTSSSHPISIQRSCPFFSTPFLSPIMKIVKNLERNALTSLKALPQSPCSRFYLTYSPA